MFNATLYLFFQSQMNSWRMQKGNQFPEMYGIGGLANFLNNALLIAWQRELSLDSANGSCVLEGEKIYDR